ncbi:hypothetical protein chiPu_0013402 [Chiloscyllium punctatum]|uniref:Ion transport domain-containing protein n=1 Tax=Chiloscyllium punctatum TaxID=137246 RepID=A0A401SX02_CHIPU|nr:hypothetical protein [Chiloscyllium punctatum]
MDTLKLIPERKGVSQIHSKENPRAEIIRAKLIQDFNLLDHLQGLVINNPRYNMNDVKDPKVLSKLMIEDPLQLVRFDFNPIRNTNVSSNYRQRNCLQNRYVKYPPLNMWAQWILDSSFFRNLILYLIILNTIVFGVLVDVADKPGPKYHAIKIMLVIIDWCILSVLTCEIILRWLYDFVNFWKSGWNVFDLTVLIVTITFILLLVLIFADVFAVVGVSLFRSYTESDKPGLYYHTSFRSVLLTFQTLFQLFTLDHWYALLTDIWQVDEVDVIASGIYIMLWILIGSFIFRNIIVGIMVSNFQSIRKDLATQIKRLEAQRRADHFKLQMMQRRLSPEISVKDVLNKGERRSESDITHVSEIDFKSSSHASHSSDLSYKAGKDWEDYIRKNMKLMQSNLAREKVIWPRDSLFHYYELLEQLQYNLGERKKLQFLAAQALVNMHDV